MLYGIVNGLILYNTVDELILLVLNAIVQLVSFY